MKVTRSIKEEALFLFRVTLTVTLVRIVGAKALQISAVPLAVFAHLTSVQVKVEPVVKVTPFTCALVPLAAGTGNANRVTTSKVTMEQFLIDQCWQRLLHCKRTRTPDSGRAPFIVSGAQRVPA